MIIANNDCMEVMARMPDNSVDLVVMDPPYEIYSGKTGGCFGREARAYHNQIYDNDLDKGISNNVLDELCRVMKKINIYTWCNKTQLRQYIDYFEDKGCTTELLFWGKTNPVPTCNNKYLSDIEYLLFFREKGVNIYGSYKTKHKYYITPTNKADKERWGHPTIKPLEIIENLIINSSKEGELVFDPFMGTGTTGVACHNLNRDFIGAEIDEKVFTIAKTRLTENNMIQSKH